MQRVQEQDAQALLVDQPHQREVLRRLAGRCAVILRTEQTDQIALAMDRELEHVSQQLPLPLAFLRRVDRARNAIAKDLPAGYAARHRLRAATPPRWIEQPDP